MKIYIKQCFPDDYGIGEDEFDLIKGRIFTAYEKTWDCDVLIKRKNGVRQENFRGWSLCQDMFIVLTDEAYKKLKELGVEEGSYE
jgi:hypothetical protein